MQNICPYCGERPLSNRRNAKTCGNQKCIKENYKKSFQQRTLNLKSKGMCIKCGKIPARPNRTTCEICGTKASKYQVLLQKILRSKSHTARSEAAIILFANKLGYWPSQREWNKYASKNGYYTSVALYEHTKTTWEKYREKFGFSPRRKIFTRDECFKAIELAARELGPFFTRKEYKEWRNQLYPELPTYQQIAVRCGGFNAAKAGVGLIPNPAWGKTFTDDEIKQALRACAVELGTLIFSENHYEKWRAGRNDIPCVETIRKRFGGIPEAKKQMGLDSYEQGPQEKYTGERWKEGFWEYLKDMLSLESYIAWARGKGGPSQKAIYKNAGGHDAALIEMLPLYVQMLAARNKRE